jgi:hypothetical protein
MALLAICLVLHLLPLSWSLAVESRPQHTSHCRNSAAKELQPVDRQGKGKERLIRIDLIKGQQSLSGKGPGRPFDMDERQVDVLEPR